jgi:predicted enzyme involved in methoxymalonyl-ACP biosynthesis
MARDCIDQMVMSCRALGLGLEDAFLSYLAGGKHETIFGRLLPTEANMACRPIYSRNGFVPVEGNPTLWCRAAAPAIPRPEHVALAIADGG